MGITDLSNKDSRTILTFDADYGELIFKHGFKPTKGVIFLKLIEFTAIEPGQIIHKLTLLPDFSTDNILNVLHKDGIRQRKY